MKLIALSQRPHFRRLFKLFGQAFCRLFLDEALNRELKSEASDVCRATMRFARQISKEAFVILRYGMLWKIYRFKRNLRNRCRESMAHDDMNIYDFFLKEIGVSVDVSCADDRLEAHIPSEGCATLVIANHAYPPYDALCILKTVADVRNDFWIVANSNNPMFSLFPDYTRNAVRVHMNGGIMGSNDIELVNTSRTRAAFKILDLLRKGKCVILFPAGEGSKALANDGQIVDVEWNPGLGFIVDFFAKRSLPLKILPVFVPEHMGTEKNSQIYREAILKSPDNLPAALQIAFFNPPSTIRIGLGRTLDQTDFQGVGRLATVNRLRESVYSLRAQLFK